MCVLWECRNEQLVARKLQHPSIAFDLQLHINDNIKILSDHALFARIHVEAAQKRAVARDIVELI